MAALEGPTYRVYPNEIDRILRKPGGPIGVKLRSICLDIATEAERLTLIEVGKDPRDAPRTGKMAKAWAVTVETYHGFGAGYAFVVKNTKQYAKYVDEGSNGPYQIKARNKKYLRFKDRSGRWRTVMVVTHPGLRNPYHILRRATRSTISKRLR